MNETNLKQSYLMIDIYTEKKDSKDWILKNDLYFNIIKHPDKVVCVEECGPNVLKIIFAMDNIKIYMLRPMLVEIPDDAEIRFIDEDVVIGNSGYNAWSHLFGWIVYKIQFCYLGFADILPILSAVLIHIVYVIEGYSSVLALCFYHDTVSQSIAGYPLGACRFLLGVG